MPVHGPKLAVDVGDVQNHPDEITIPRLGLSVMLRHIVVTDACSARQRRVSASRRSQRCTVRDPGGPQIQLLLYRQGELHGELAVDAMLARCAGAVGQQHHGQAEAPL
jgi:hypothetical protein